MLDEHLSQAHDRASRRASRITAHVRWIHERVLRTLPTRVLDLACGPGLYTAGLAELGHEAVGVDFAPAAIACAQDQAGARGLCCSYRLGDIRSADYGAGYGLAMLIFGELNVFRPIEARTILARTRGALADGGLLLLEAHTYGAVHRMGEAPRSWQSAERGL